MSHLLLWLEGPLQSWGADSRYMNRATLPFPTRSGVSGLLCCALGRGDEQVEWLQELSTWPLTVKGYARLRKDKPVRESLLFDYHLIGAGYDTNDQWQSLLVPKKFDGKNGSSPVKITIRQYLQDMAFACVLEVPGTEAEALGKALDFPIWQLFLGRRCCPPSERIFRGVFENQDEAFTSADAFAAEKKRGEIIRVTEGADQEGDEIWTLNDVPVRFGVKKRYRDRQVTIWYPN